MAVQLRERFKGMFKRGKSKDLVKREEKGREAVVNELRRGYSDLVDTMHSVRQHMEDQSRRSDRLMEVIETLPGVLQSIPESAKQQNKMMEGLTESLRVQNRSTGELTKALSGLAEATRQQEQSLSKMQDRLNDRLSRDEDAQQAMISGIDQMTSAVQGVTRDQHEGRTTIAQVAEQSRRQQKQMVAMNGVSWALAVLALGVAAWVAVKLVDAGPAGITGRSAPDSQTPAPVSAPPEQPPVAAQDAQTPVGVVQDTAADSAQTSDEPSAQDGPQAAAQPVTSGDWAQAVNAAGPFVPVLERLAPADGQAGGGPEAIRLTEFTADE